MGLGQACRREAGQLACNWTGWKVVGIHWKDIKGLERSWKIMETGRMFGLCDHLSSFMTWRCIKTSRTLSFRLVSAQYLMYIRAHRPLTWKNNCKLSCLLQQDRLWILLSSITIHLNATPSYLAYPHSYPSLKFINLYPLESNQSWNCFR